MWKELWDNPHWMKVKLFKCLVQQRKILTWDNLRKRGFFGPSRCHLCGDQEETTNHILNRCSFTTTLWNWVGDVFEQTDRHDCNNRIFKGKASPVNNILKLILKQLKETIHILGGVTTGKPIRKREAKILEKLELKVNLPCGSIQINKNTSAEKTFWQPPSQGFVKFNIDGTSKGNSREAGYGGVMRDEEGNIQVIFHSYLGRATNNIAELMAMELCLETLLKYNIHNVIIEADSELVINLVKRINVGAAPEKISGHWWLLQVYQRIQSHLRVLRTLRLVHVRRESNKVVNWLANEGV
eukprot:PITA_13096